MLVLAIETSHEPGSIALLEGSALLGERILTQGKRRGQSLILEIQDLFREQKRHPRETELVAVGIGPGSFTGLRVGIVAAKSIAYACGVPVAAIPTLHSIVENLPQEILQATAVIDAQRGEIFLQKFERSPTGVWSPRSEIGIESFDRWQSEISPDEWGVGPGLRGHEPAIRCQTPKPELWDPQAFQLGLLASNPEFQVTAWDLLPLYVRKSAAEETWDQKQTQTAPSPP